MQGAGEGELSNMTQVIPEAIQRAARAVGAQPSTSEEKVAKEASSNTALQAAFQDEIGVGIRHRLQNDPDFTPVKYPNTDKYFNKKQ